EGLPRPDVDRLAVDGPRQYALDTADRFLVMIMTVCWSSPPLGGGNRELEKSYAAARVFSSDQEADSERTETDGLVGRVHVNVARLRCHASSALVNIVDIVNPAQAIHRRIINELNAANVDASTPASGDVLRYFAPSACESSAGSCHGLAQHVLPPAWPARATGPSTCRAAPPKQGG